MPFRRDKSEVLKQSRDKQEQLNFTQSFTSTHPTTNSERVEIALVGDQLAVFVNMAVRVKDGGFFPTFEIQMNGLDVSEDDGIFGDTVATERCIGEGKMRNCKGSHISSPKRF